jgi:phage terminase small subunit
MLSKPPEITHSAPGKREMSVAADELGLTDKQEAFVRYLVSGTCKGPKEAAERAGYKGMYVSQTSWQLMQNEKVKAFLAIATRARLLEGAAQAANTVIDLSAGAKSEHVRLQASQDVLDRVGYREPDKKQMHHTGGVSINIDLS